MKGDVPTYMRATNAVLPHLSETAIAGTIEILLGLNHLNEAKEITLGADRCNKRSNDLDAQRLLAYRLCSIEQPRQKVLYKRLSTLPASALADSVKKALAWYAFECADFAAAKNHCLTVRQIDPKTQSILVRSHFALGERKEARELLERYIAEQPENGEMLFLLACCDLEERNTRNAGKNFLSALENGFCSIEEINKYPLFKMIFAKLGSGKIAAE
jgi:tetratricopeptide (TPR) repeat protein